MLPASPPAAAARSADRWSTSLAGEAVELYAERALLWTRMRTLFVADVHLGKAAAFRAGGVPVPRGSTASDLARLGALVEASGAKRLCVLGDFLHAKAGVWLGHRVRVVWAIDPIERTVTVYGPGADPAVVREPDAADAAPVLPGLCLSLVGLFLGVPR